MVDDRTPVMVGAAQWCGDRHPDLAKLPTPLGVLEDVARRAADDAGAPAVLGSLDAILLTSIHTWDGLDPVGALAARLGAAPRARYVTGSGGEGGIRAANWAAERIAAGELDSALVGGCSLRARARGDDELFGGPTPGLDADALGWSDAEGAHGLVWPHLVYAVYENARRAHLGLGFDEHAARMGRLMAPFSEVAARNPYAWFPTARSAEELVTITPENRMVAFPYPKYLNAVRTDQGAAVLVLSAGRARAFGIPEDRWAYWWGGDQSNERGWYWTIRPSLTQVPAMHRAQHGALASAGIGVDAVDGFDFYSCFPIAVSMACAMLGIDEGDRRPFTLTGGLPYAGGPGAAYTVQSLATALGHLRARPEETVLLTGNGWFFTKHAAGVWSGRPRETAPRDAPPSLPDEPVALEESPSGTGAVEGYTVAYDRDGAPERGVVVGRLASGPRFVAELADPAALEGREGVGVTGTVTPGPTNRFDPS